MLVRQTANYLAANLSSALFGFVNVVVFTRIFTVDAYGDYLLGLAFATLFATFLGSALKLSILREQARGDGADIARTSLAALILCCACAPPGYAVARLVNLQPEMALASVCLALAIVVFEASQEMLRAQQKASAFMRGTLLRAALVCVLGLGCALVSRTGVLLLASSSLAFLAAAATFWRGAWGSATPQFDWKRLHALVIGGLPLTLSFSLLALSSVADRFLIANLSGVAAAGQFGASLDLVRQSLIIPAVSVASSFVPMTVRLLAANGAQEARAHLRKYFEILLAITLPACVGLAIVSPQIADLVLGPGFRQTAREAMPVLAVAVAFQLLIQQYLHVSFLLSKRNVFYLANTGSMLVFNVALSFVLIPHFGVMGAVWGRVAAELFGFVTALAMSRAAFRLPFPGAAIVRIGIGVAGMAIAVRALEPALAAYGAVSLFALIPVGIAVYGAAALLLDIAGLRTLVRRLDIWRPLQARIARRALGAPDR